MGIATYFEYLFGGFAIPVMITAFIAFMGFLLAAFFVQKYVKKFYIAGVPEGWKYFYIGLILNALHQLLEVIYTFGIIGGTLSILFFSIFQIVAAGILVYGLYLIRKEINIGMVPGMPLEIEEELPPEIEETNKPKKAKKNLEDELDIKED